MLGVCDVAQIFTFNSSFGSLDFFVQQVNFCKGLRSEFVQINFASASCANQIADTIELTIFKRDILLFDLNNWFRFDECFFDRLLDRRRHGKFDNHRSRLEHLHRRDNYRSLWNEGLNKMVEFHLPSSNFFNFKNLFSF